MNSNPKRLQQTDMTTISPVFSGRLLFLGQESRSGCSNKIGNLTHGVRSSNKIGCLDISLARDAMGLPNRPRARVRAKLHENVFNVLGIWYRGRIIEPEVTMPPSYVFKLLDEKKLIQAMPSKGKRIVRKRN